MLHIHEYLISKLDERTLLGERDKFREQGQN